MNDPLLCIFAHPDDESFGPGGTIAKFAKERDVFLICVTDGNAQRRFRASREINLEDKRHKELLSAAAILGIKQVDFFHFPDGELCNNLYHKITSRLQEKVDYYKPDTLLTFEPRGVSGHIDHITVSLTTSFIFRENLFIKNLFYYCVSKRISDQMNNYFIYFPEGFEKSDVDLVIDVKDVWEQKIAAIKAHESQQKDVEWLLEQLKYDPKEEYFLVKKR